MDSSPGGSPPLPPSPSLPSGLEAGAAPQPQPPPSTPSSPSASSPAPSRPSPPARYATTPPPEEAGEDYFDRIGPQPSHQSAVSVGRPPGAAAPDARRPGPPRLPSIRLRLSSASLGRLGDASAERDAADPDGPPRHGARSRSASQSSAASAPADASCPPAWLAAQLPGSPARNARRAGPTALPRLTEEGPRPAMADLGLVAVARPPIAPGGAAVHEEPADEEKAGGPGAAPEHERRRRLRRVSRFFWPGRARRGSVEPPSVVSAESRHQEEYHEELVDWLDIIDPQVQTLSTLTNVQNSLFVPDLGTWVDRRPAYVLSQPDLPARKRPTADGQAAEAPGPEPDEPAETESAADAGGPEHPAILRSTTITSRLSESHYASLPHGRTLDGWSAADKRELDDRVRHMLHSRRSRFKRTMKGFGQYVRRPLGFFVTLYAVLITLLGLAWVLFLIGWIYVGEEQVYAIHVIDSILVALFAIMGDGLAPFRAIDTYHMIFVLRYSRMIKNASKPPRSRLRRRRGRPEVRLDARDEAATPPRAAAVEGGSQTGQGPENGEAAGGGGGGGGGRVDVEDGKPGDDMTGYYPLNAKQVKRLLHHQKKLAKSHSFYKPQETHTHHSFPLNFLVATVIFLDLHSCLQVSLGACTWGIDYHVRPFALTTVILCVSITCNLSAGLVITVGDRRTRKKDVIKLLDRQELTGDAIARMEYKKEKEDRRREAILERMAAA